MSDGLLFFLQCLIIAVQNRIRSRPNVFYVYLAVAGNLPVFPPTAFFLTDSTDSSTEGRLLPEQY